MCWFLFFFFFHHSMNTFHSMLTGYNLYTRIIYIFFLLNSYWLYTMMKFSTVASHCKTQFFFFFSALLTALFKWNPTDHTHTHIFSIYLLLKITNFNMNKKMWKWKIKTKFVSECDMNCILSDEKHAHNTLYKMNGHSLVCC